MIREAPPVSIVAEEKKTPLTNGDLPLTNGLSNGSEEENLENNHENSEKEPRSDLGPSAIQDDQVLYEHNCVAHRASVMTLPQNMIL